MKRSLTLDAQTLDDTFPWHLVIDAELRVRSAGHVLRRLVPDVDRLPLDALFHALRPSEPLSAESFRVSSRRAWLLQSIQIPLLVLRGQLVPTAEGMYAFIGGPRATIDVIRTLDLTLTDFAAHDAIGDWLFVTSAQQASLAEATRFSNELGALNGKLEDLVAARTRDLTDANEALVRSANELRATLSALSDAKAGLEREKAERERVEDELRLAQRLEAVGQLASGVAHEINTPIQYIGNSVQFAHEAFGDLIKLYPMFIEAVASLRAHGDTPLAERLESARDAADAEFLVEQVPKAFERAFDGLNQVAQIVRAMKAFAHPGAENKAPADINEAIKNTLVVSRNEYKYVADVETELGDLPLVTCNVGELNQVFLNLIVNAAHAIGDKVAGTESRGHVRIRTSRADAKVAIEISDDGAGIPDEIKDRIFDPFFTTKPVGKGTGQGLMIARSIIVKHDGKIEVRSTPGQGTTFKITLPLDVQEAA